MSATIARKQATIVFMQGEEADKAFDIADSEGDHLGRTWLARLKNYLAQWDNTGGEYQWEDEREPSGDGSEISFVYGTDEDGQPLSTAEVRYVLKWNETASWCALEVHASEKFIAANQS